MNNSRPALSVIVPMWGVEKYIEKCARSLFESTLEDIEFVFVNDCTPDKSVEVLERVMTDYPKRAKQTSIVHHEVNKGLPQARKTGFEACHGEWITYCDSDDWVHLEMYEKMLATANEGGCDLVCCDFVFQSDDKVLWEPVYDKSNSSEILRMDLISGNVSNAVWNKIVHRSVYESSGLYFPFLSMDEDDVITCQLAYFSKKIGYIHECLYYHYANPESMTNVKTQDKIERGIRQRIENRKWIVSFLESRKDRSLTDAIIKYKVSVKVFISMISHKHSRNVYPEVNKNMIFSRDISLLRRFYNFIFLYFYPLYLLKDTCCSSANRALNNH